MLESMAMRDRVHPHEILSTEITLLARVHAEMIRPTVDASDFGGFDFEMLRVGSLARMIQIRCGYLHTCTPNYCLKDWMQCRRSAS